MKKPAVLLTAGIVSAIIMAVVASKGYVNGPQPIIFSAMAAVGSVCALGWIKTKKRAFLILALVLIVPPAGVLALYGGIMVLLSLLFAAS